VDTDPALVARIRARADQLAGPREGYGVPSAFYDAGQTGSQHRRRRPAGAGQF